MHESKHDKKESKKQEMDEELDDCEVTEKIVHSDYQNMLENFENNKFWEFSNKIETEMKKLKDEAPIEIVSVNKILKDLSIQSFENMKNLSI